MGWEGLQEFHIALFIYLFWQHLTICDSFLAYFIHSLPAIIEAYLHVVMIEGFSAI